MTRHVPRSFIVLVAVLATLLAMVVAPLRLHLTPRADAASTGAIKLRVQSASTVNTGSRFVHAGDPITAYKWLITRDSVGDANDSPDNCLPPRGRTPAVADSTDRGYTDRCKWPSARYTSGNVPVLTQGDQSELSGNVALADIPVGDYLISVLADGYKIDGVHFTVTGGPTTPTVMVAMEPYPLPLGTVRMRVFNDQAPVDGTYEVGSQEDSDCSATPAPGRACLSGFVAHLSDVFGEVTTDYYGNPLCTKYVTNRQGRVVFTDGSPTVTADSPGKCLSDGNGDIVIPNLGPNRYAATVVPPSSGPYWFQTTTLEGGHDWDIWTQEGDLGYDTEQTIGQEMVPAVQFGFVRTTAAPGGTGAVKGTGVVFNTYIGGTGGLTVPETGVAGANVRGPVPGLLVALSDLGNNDQMVYMGRAAANGSFNITGVPAGSYQLTLWDEDQDFIIDSFNVTVGAGETVDIGQKGLAGWFSEFQGTVFLDTNANGRRDPGEQGVRQFPLTLHERDNSLMDQGQNLAQTDNTGHYRMRQSYPLSRWYVLEAFHTGYKSTGITIQADNDPQERTYLGTAVDLNVLPVIGLRGRIDWGVQRYDGAENGGIVGTISYDTTRNETDPQDALSESYQPGIPNIPVDLYAAQHDENGDVVYNGDGSVAVETGAGGQPLKLSETVTSEQWDQSRGCSARMHNGDELTDQLALPPAGDEGELCVEAPMLGWYAQPSDANPDNFGQTVNGNYGFGTSDYNLLTPDDPDDPVDANGDPLPYLANLADNGLDPQPLVNTEYVVKVSIPQDQYGKPLYKVTQEEDVNVFDGDSYLPQANFPPTLAEATHTPSGAQPTPTGPPTDPPSQGVGIRSGCAGADHRVHVTDQPFIDGGGSPFEGEDRPTCEAKLVDVRGNQAVAPNFNLFTEVPLPTHFWGLVINDLGLSQDKRLVGYAEAQPLPHVPTGIYNWKGRLVDTVESDYNGIYEAIEPSTGTFNCPLPAGPCPNMYRFVGNDPGQPGHVNVKYNPRFRTIATNFQAWPGLFTVTDTAPTQVAVTALAPDGSQVNPVDCSPAASQPQVFSISRPVLRATSTTTAARTVTLAGRGFGAIRGSGSVSLTSVNGGPNPGPNPIASYGTWSDNSVTVVVKSRLQGNNGGLPEGQYRLSVTNGAGTSSTNGISILQRGNGNGNSPTDPIIFTVNAPASERLPQAFPLGLNFTTNSANIENDHALQNAVNAAALTSLIGGNNGRSTMVLVWPAAPARNNPTGDIYENVILPRQVMLQGVGPGGFQADGSYVQGSRLNGLGFNPDNARGAAWVNLANGLPNVAGPDTIPDAAVVTVLQSGNLVNNGVSSIDGFTITGGSQADFATNLAAVRGGTRTPRGAPLALVTQGGGIYVHGGTRNLQVTDNVIVGNSGSYGGAVRVGTAYATDAVNQDLRIAYNQIRDNGGTNLAGAIGLFANTRGYTVERNDLCGNFSAEYGGAIGHFGRSLASTVPGGHQVNDISNNRLWFNQSYDEGGAVMVAGELAANLNDASTGSGPMSIHENLVQDNLANDDGGGLRFLQAGNFPISVVNNIIANNISAHEGGGVALDDSTNVRFVNNTVYGNITTATAVTSDGTPAPAGLSTAQNSFQLQATLPSGSATFSNPLLFNNIFWDNRAGSWNGAFISGIGSADAPASDPVNRWDMGAADASGLLSPTNSIVQVGLGTTSSASNSAANPQVVSAFDTSVTALASRTFPSFRQAVIVVQNVPPALMGNYHVTAGSPALNLAAESKSGVAAPSIDIDSQTRPQGAGRDPGADER